MPDFPPDPAESDVVAVVSRQVDEDTRAFELESPPPEDADLPELGDLRHENDLVEAMKARGYRLTMVGGGAGTDELRRFYFRRTTAAT